MIYLPFDSDVSIVNSSEIMKNELAELRRNPLFRYVEKFEVSGGFLCLKGPIEKMIKECYTIIKAHSGQGPQHLDNRIAPTCMPSSGGDFEMAKHKINQSITINGVKRWITANSMQEFADKVTRLLGMPQDRGKHLFSDYAWNWYNTYSAPNVETATATTYKRQSACI